MYAFDFITPKTLRPVRPGLGALTVHEWEQAVLYRGGRAWKTLGPGRHRVWARHAEVRVVDTRPSVMTVPTQEVPTADGTSVKVTVSAIVRAAEPEAYVAGSASPYELVYLAVQLALRAVVSALSVEELLAARPELGARLLASVDPAGFTATGLVIERLEIKDLILPPELKRAQAEVLVARAQGLAALERARGETAALRSLANAARQAADNPALLQLRLLQELGSSSGHTVLVGLPAGTTPVPTPPR